jgi:hypothetical protein
MHTHTHSLSLWLLAESLRASEAILRARREESLICADGVFIYEYIAHRDEEVHHRLMNNILKH